MNPDTGELARLDRELTGRYRPGDVIHSDDVAGAPDPPADERQLRADLQAALERAEHARMIAVSNQVAQRVALGNRELARRRRRR